MIIDGHAHACGVFLTPESIINELNKAGVDKVVLVPGELGSSKNYSMLNIARVFPSKNVVKLTNSLTRFVMKITNTVKQIPEGNEFVYELTRQTQGRVIQFLWITQQVEKPKEFLTEKLLEWNFKGIKMHQCWENFSINSKFFNIVAGWAEENDIPLFIHLLSDTDVKNIIEYKKSHPKLKLLIAHLFGLELFIKANIKDENLYFDSSTMQLISKRRILNAIKFVGADKVTMGTDTPYGKNNLQKNIDRINDLDISSEKKDLILGENIKRLLNL